ncbi:UPF0481 protein At3g47200-like [Carya illinoinensis]|uniref:Uncharacterized protein n=1 Tax=Carya illinoinensis TaxID=32201 RepID=A0A8T1N1T9_CARIL|nr:UPF0481 protein At3g47200-like [Carya illinoinensis]KAG6624626.1 hypothetical protein CIPAW_16G041400 [Carya illinoinensis]
MDRSPRFISDKELRQQEIDVIEQQEIIRISEVGEYSSANYPERKREFPEEERNIIKERLRIYAGEAKKLHEEAERGSTSCIYRVLPRLKEINGNRPYEPNMVCIGPYYYHKRHEEKFHMAEDCKRKCIGSLLVKTTDEEEQIDTYMSWLQRISELEEEIRKCYSEEFEVAGTEFIEMMVVDACFIIEIIEMFGYGREVNFGESLAALGWMVPYFHRDFLLLENQIPFFVLVEICKLTRNNIPAGHHRSYVIYPALQFFMNGMKRFDSDIFDFILKSAKTMDHSPPLHLLDLVRRCLIRPVATRMGELESSVKTPFIHCISKLRQAGIKVSPGKGLSCFLEVEFKKGVIEMPNIAIDDLMRCLLLNCVAFEQCDQRISSKYFTAYTTFLDCLVNTEEDVEYLREHNVIDNYLSDDTELAGFINCAGKDLVLNGDHGFYLGKLFENVNNHYRNRWKWKLASFEREYFDKPWLLLSAAGGILLILATSFQAVMAFLTYKYKKC